MPDVPLPASPDLTHIKPNGVLDALQPRIADQEILTPTRYWGLLAEAQALLQLLGEQQATHAITNAAALLAEELELMQIFEQRRRSSAR
ncbi:MAG: hypothetical protein V2J55_17615 [Candidatus Competibacteraceae bacterium]|jgi:hypothetical protein|nr:hypothetical protein [Candidatus Competibacteraceae bacterium]